MMSIKKRIESIYSKEVKYSQEALIELSGDFIDLLDKGEIRAAEPDGKGSWKTNAWVKKGILLLFKYGRLEDMSINKSFNYFDKHTIPLKKIDIKDNIRLVPGGSSIRQGAYLAPGVICMPPMFINIGSYVDEGTMIDSHALVGTCAQVGKRVHLSAASQLGGVLEPPNATPVIVEDDVMIGGNCGVYEGVIIKRKAVLGSGVIITSSTKIYDVVNETVISAKPGKALEVPENAVIIPGTRNLTSKFAIDNGLAISTPIIIKYRDEKTDAKTALNEILR